MRRLVTIVLLALVVATSADVALARGRRGGSYGRRGGGGWPNLASSWNQTRTVVRGRETRTRFTKGGRAA